MLRESRFASTLVVTGGFFATFVTAGFSNAFGVFQQYYSTHELQDKSAFQIIWLASFQNFILFAFAPLSGIMSDRLGPLIPLSIGAVAMLVSVFMTSLCSEYYQFFLAQGLLMGVGMSFLVIPSVAAVSRTFVRHNGLAMGIVIAGSSIGGVIWPIEVNQLLNVHHLSFGWTMRIVGFTMLPICGFVPLVVRPLSPKKEEPREAMSNTEKDDPEAQSATVAPPNTKTDTSIIKNPAFLFLCSGMAVLFLGFFTPIFFVTSYGVAEGLSTDFSFYLTSITLAASFFGRVAPGFYADKYGPFNVLLISAVFSAVIAFCWTAATTTAGIVLWSLAYGFSSGSFLSLQSTCASRLSTPQTRGMAIGLVMGAAAITGLVGPPISGALEPHGYLPLSMFVGAVIIAGTFLILGSRLAQDKRLRAIV